MYLLNRKKTILIENYNNEINSIDIIFDEDYMNKILIKLEHFTNFYCELLSNIEFQRIVLLGTKYEFNALFKKF